MSDMATLDRKIDLLEGLAQAWTSDGLSWAVCNGLDGYPDGIGRDLDIVIERKDLRPALARTVDYLRDAGYTPLPFKLGWLYWVVGLIEHEGVVESVQVDLFDHLQWAFSWPVDGVRPSRELEKQGPFLIDPAASIGKRIIINTLSGNSGIFAKKPHYLELGAGEGAILDPVLKSLSGSDEDAMAEAIRTRDVAALAVASSGFRSRVLHHSLVPGRNWLRRVHSAILKQWSMNLFPARAVPTIAVQSDDAAIEAAVCERLVGAISNQLVFCKVIEERDRPRFLFKSGVRWPWQVWIDHHAGERLRDRRRSALQCVQIYRGHALTLHLDPARAGLAKFPAWMAMAAPRPQLNVFITEQGSALADSWLESGRLDLVLRDPEAAAGEIFTALINKLQQISAKQCRRLNL